MTKYYRDLFTVVINKSYPEFENDETLEKLNNIADQFIKENSVSGSISAIVIYHQLTENMVKVLIECSRLWVKLKIVPDKIEFSSLKGKMFGKLLEEYSISIGNEEFKESCERINQIRIDIVHKLTKSKLEDITTLAVECKKKFDEICVIFEQEYENYCSRYKNITKYPEEFAESLLDISGEDCEDKEFAKYLENFLQKNE